MQRSASDLENTADALFPGKEESNGWGYGHTSLAFCGAGILVLTVVFSTAYHSPMTVGPIAWLALSVTLTIGGLIGACSTFAEQRRERSRTAFATELLALESATKETSNETRLNLATLAGATRVLTNRQEQMIDLLAHASLEQAPPKAQRPARPRRRRHHSGAEGTAGAPDNVVPLRARRAADALRRLTERIEDQPGE